LLIIRGTAKLLRELGIPKAQAGSSEDGVLGSWFANLFRYERRKCVILVNDRTLYCVVLFGLLKRDMANLGNLFINELAKSLTKDGIPTELVASVATACHPIVWRPTNNRSVLGSMNELIQQLKFMASRRSLGSEQEIQGLNRQLNRTLMGPLGSSYAVERMREALQVWSP